MTDWLQEVRSFPRLDLASAALSVPEREAAEAVARYNKAVALLAADGADIAAIELRKASATTPSFGQALVLLGCLQMAAGTPVSAFRTFRKADGASMPDALRVRLDGYAREASAAAATATEAFEERGEMGPAEARAALLDARAMQGLLRPARGKASPTRLPARSRRPAAPARSPFGGPLLSDLAAGASPGTGAAEAPDPRPPLRGSTRAVAQLSGGFRGRLRGALRILLVLILAGALVAAGLYGIPRLVAAWPFGSPSDKPTPTPDAVDRLQWILAAIAELRASGKPVSAELRALLEAFNEEFPEAAVSIPPDPTASPVPATPTPVETSDAERLRLAAADLADAETKAVAGDAVGAAELLLSVREALASLPSGTTAAGVDGTAGDALESVKTLLARVGKTACDAWRRAGMDLFYGGRPADALVPLLKAYAIDPGFFGGGVAYHIGRCYEALGQKDEARAFYQYVIDHYPAKDIADFSRSRIARLG